MTTVVCHYTVGRDSRNIGLNGYFNFLVSRDGTVWQYAEADAVTWHAGNPTIDWNQRGPGIEVEYLPGADDTVFTDAQRDATGALVHWLADTYNIPLDYYDGQRIDAWAGFIAHNSLVGADHTDTWPRDDWDRMMHKEDDILRGTAISKQGDPSGMVWFFWGCYKTHIPNPQVFAVMQFCGIIDGNIYAQDPAFVDALVDMPCSAVPGSAAPAALTQADVDRIAKRTADELSKRLVS
jgi:hypothetical protein